MIVLCICGEPDSPAHPFRFLRWVEDFESAGLQCSWMTISEAARHLPDVSKSEILFVWRAAWDSSVEAIVRAARSNRATVVFDADDIVIEPALARIEVIDAIRTRHLPEAEVEHYFRRTLDTFEAADFASCSTEEIAAFMRARGKNTAVVPNGFNEPERERSQQAMRRRRETPADGVVRIGYVAGSPSHQRDLAVVADALASVLREQEHCRVVLFRGMVDLGEFPSLRRFSSHIEWRDFVSQHELPEEFARLDVSIAPLEVGNSFCECKSELKYVQAALAEVCTIASPTGPFRRAIRPAETGFLPVDVSSWTSTLRRLANDADLRHRIGRAAYADVVNRYNPARRRQRIAELVTVWTQRSVRNGLASGDTDPPKPNHVPEDRGTPATLRLREDPAKK